MSKPNRLQFGTAVGFYRNPRVRDFHDSLKKVIPRKVDFAELAPMLFQVLMSAAAENRIDGDFSSYTPERWTEIFTNNNVAVSAKEAREIRELFEKFGLTEGGKIRSWKKFNPHLAEDDQNQKQRKLAGKLSAKKRTMEAKAALKNGGIPHAELEENPDENPEENAPKTEPEKPSPSKQLWLIEKALEGAKGKARKQLLRQKEQLLASELDVDLSEPAPRPALVYSEPARQTSAADFERTLLKSAHDLIANGNADVISEGMARALINAGEDLPVEVKHKFSKLLKQSEKNSARNPVPG